MEAPTAILVGTSAILGMFVLMLVKLKRRQWEDQQLEDDHDRAAKREDHWYALDQPMTNDH
jgi:hypothetical protein